MVPQNTAPLICFGAVTAIFTPLFSAPVQLLPQSGQFPSGYVASSSGVSTAFPQLAQWTTGVLVAGSHSEPFGVLMIVVSVTFYPYFKRPSRYSSRSERMVMPPN